MTPDNCRPIIDARCPVSDVRCPMSDVRCQMPTVRGPANLINDGSPQCMDWQMLF